MPADITGTEILDEADGVRALRFVRGPIFAQILLADEINRTPPKTQAALLEAMQEFHVTAAGRTYALERPFFVLATQNPIELEGTYPLPEAQLDRFMFNVVDVVPLGGRRGAGRHPDDRQRPSPARARAERRRHPELPGLRAPGGGGRGSGALRGAAGGRVAAGPRPEARVRREVRQVGRRAARVAGAHPRRQGAGADPRPLPRVGQGHPGAGGADPAPPRDAELLRRGRRHHRRRHRRAAARRPCRRRPAGCDAMAGPRPATSTRRCWRGSARSTSRPRPSSKAC